jgi:hypothetical protein
MQQLHTVATTLVSADLAVAVRCAIDALQTLMQTAQTHIDEQYAQAIELGSIDEQQRLESAEPQQWLDQSRKSLQAGMMFLDRALQQPTTF